MLGELEDLGVSRMNASVSGAMLPKILGIMALATLALGAIVRRQSQGDVEWQTVLRVFPAPVAGGPQAILDAIRVAKLTGGDPRVLTWLRKVQTWADAYDIEIPTELRKSTGISGSKLS